ncbi:hypothetical protein QEZ52_19180 [Aliisedimentitalea scapharcae]|uniref:Uncharacterized protein n=1 Tax=Aliisedimentitalea scapharcae TaxID=1524259 RepID=A0ABZ2XRG3_9RHOB
MLTAIATYLIRSSERRIGVSLDYVHQIAQTKFSLLMRYNRIFGFLDPNRNVPPDAYHTARLCGALAADCGTCVEAEINLAVAADVPHSTIDAVLGSDEAALSDNLCAVLRLATAITAERQDDPDARAAVVRAYGEAGLIELSFAMNGAAMLPGIKRAMGHATQCDLSLMRKLARPKT